jgi:rod shape-determining protein MreB
MPIDLAIDFGTSKTVLLCGNKILLEQPTVATVDSETWEPVSFGEKAKEMIGRLPDYLESVFPIQRGMIADYDIAEQMLTEYFTNSLGKRLIKPRIIIAMPSGATSIQRRSLENAAEIAGGRRVQVIDSGVAAALGMGIDFTAPGGKMIVDIGAGVTDIATLSAGGIVQCDSAPIGSLDFDEAIIKYVRKEFNVLIGNLTAEEIKKQIGSVIPRNAEVVIKAKGRNLFSGLPQLFEITSTDVYNAMKDTAGAIFAAINSVIERTPPDIVADIMSDKIHVTGGGALVNGMADFLGQNLNTDVHIRTDAEYSVVKGAQAALKYPELIKNIDYQLKNIQDLIVET